MFCCFFFLGGGGWWFTIGFTLLLRVFSRFHHGYCRRVMRPFVCLFVSPERHYRCNSLNRDFIHRPAIRLGDTQYHEVDLHLKSPCSVIFCVPRTFKLFTIGLDHVGGITLPLYLFKDVWYQSEMRGGDAMYHDADRYAKLPHAANCWVLSNSCCRSLNIVLFRYD